MDDTEDTFIDAEISDKEKGDNDVEEEYYNQVDVRSLPKYYSHADFKHLINKKLRLHGFNFKFYNQINSPLVSVCFGTKVEMENAVLVIHKYEWKKKVLSAQRKSHVLDDHGSEGGGGGNFDDDNDHDEDRGTSSEKKKQLMDPNLSVEDKLRNSFVPLWKMEYKDQWIQQQMSIHDGMPCELLDIRYPEELTGNNCNFDLGLDAETKQAAVGCKMNCYVDNFKVIAQPDGLMHIPERVKVAVKAFQHMLRTKMNRNDIRYAKELIVRSAKDQLFLLINQQPNSRPREDRERFEKICIDDVRSFHLWGEKFFYEYPLDLKIRIYPDGFYATNSEAAELFYKTAIELMGPVENSTVVDLCCGVGPLGLCFGKHCKQVLGLDTVKMCTNFATQNAELNKVKNARYYTGRADDLTGMLCQKAEGDDVVVLCDPPRSGLTQLRNSKKVRKILYASINPKAGIKVYKSLTMAPSGKMNGEPFLPTKAVVIDMTPHTKVVHLITIWERCSHAYHSSFLNPPQVIGNMAILPFKTQCRGPAPIQTNSNEQDIIDEAIYYFKANVFFRTYEIKSEADRLLIYITLYITECLKKLQKCSNRTQGQNEMKTLALSRFDIPGDPGFPLNSVYRAYLTQLRQEVGMRVCNKVFGEDGKPSKWWLCFAKKKFMDKSLSGPGQYLSEFCARLTG
nr:unnamed protein product [Callosobruchus chinensis]